MSDAEAQLEAADAALTDAQTLTHLCAAYRSLPATRIAKAARTYAARLPSEPVSGVSVDAREEAWHALAGEQGAAALNRLLASPWSNRVKDAMRRLQVLSELGPDPRTVGALLELDTGAKFTAAAGNRFWNEVYELLLQWGSAEVASRVPPDLHAASSSSFAAARYARLFEPLRERWKDRWPREPSLSPRAVHALERLEAKLVPLRRALDELTAAVHAAPSDDGPKLVLSDALIELGDPRGELIALQFAAEHRKLSLAETERIARLIGAAGRRWFDGLDRQIAVDAVFRKGFVSEARLETRTPDPTVPAWTTLEVLETAGLALPLSSFLAHPNLRGLHSVLGLHGSTLRELASHGAAREFRLLEVTQLGDRVLDEHPWRTSALRLSASLDQAVWWLRVASHTLSAPVLQLTLNAGYERIGAAIAELERLHSGIVIVELAAAPPAWPKLWHGDWLLRFSRDERGRFSALDVSLGTELVPGLHSALQSIVPGQLKSVTVWSVITRGPVWRASMFAQIEQSLARHPNLETVSALDGPARGVSATAGRGA